MRALPPGVGNGAALPRIRSASSGEFGRRGSRLAVLAIAVVLGNGLGSAEISGSVAYEVAAEVTAPAIVAPDERRAPFGWQAFPIGGRGPAIVRWRPPSADTAVALDRPTRFRLTVAIDERSECQVEVALAKSGRRLGVLDLRYPQALQLFELSWSPDDARAVQREGIALRRRDDGPAIWCFSPDGDSAAPREFKPHLLRTAGAVDPRLEYFRRMSSLASIQPFGWMEGCVLDGLRDLAAGDPASPYEEARREHWALFLKGGASLVYEAASRPLVDRFETIEATLPVADLAAWQPGHRVVDIALRFLAAEKRSASGLIHTGRNLSAEGSYTVAYPLAVVGARRGEQALGHEALRQLLGRRDRLWHDHALWLRHAEGGARTFRNWSRGVAWYFLGLVRSLPHLRAAGIEGHEIEAEIRRIAAFVRQHQLDDGLWPCFLGERATAPDSSGSAGIAAALALGARAGVLRAGDMAAARRALAAIEARLTPDGFLVGVAQGNRGGESLQRSDYRVISQMGMGLLAQLFAAADPDQIPRVLPGASQGSR